MGALIYMIFGLIISTVGLRFLFRLFGANPSSGFVSLVYSLSTPLVTPFAGIFGQDTMVDSAVVSGVFEWASLIALIVYGLIAAILSQIGSGVGRRI
jgi:NADH:ubiquinone oxidoreductase subunit 5 (subunit L)/multisubunit Na+/H+ antiporter MnhA subunit